MGGIDMMSYILIGFILLVIVGFIAYALYTYITTHKLTDGQVAIIKQMIFALVAQAEQSFTSKTGQEKFANVMSQFYQNINKIFPHGLIANMITPNKVSGWIEDQLNAVKAYLATRPDSSDKESK
jgi:hypothetical protein